VKCALVIAEVGALRRMSLNPLFRFDSIDMSVRIFSGFRKFGRAKCQGGSDSESAPRPGGNARTAEALHLRLLIRMLSAVAFLAVLGQLLSCESRSTKIWRILQIVNTRKTSPNPLLNCPILRSSGLLFPIFLRYSIRFAPRRPARRLTAYPWPTKLAEM
jgi:hypothetical protein